MVGGKVMLVKLKARTLRYEGLTENDARTVECAFWGISTVEVMCKYFVGVRVCCLPVYFHI